MSQIKSSYTITKITGELIQLNEDYDLSLKLKKKNLKAIALKLVNLSYKIHCDENNIQLEQMMWIINSDIHKY